MNQGIPIGPQELVGAGSIAREILTLEAIGAVSLSNIVFMFPAAPANGAAVSSCSLAAMGRLYNIKSCTIVSGIIAVVYRK